MALGQSTYLDQVKAEPLQPVDDAVQCRLVRNRTAHDGLYRLDNDLYALDLGQQGLRQPRRTP